MITLGYGGNTCTFTNLLGHPYGYEEGETRRGRVARRWAIGGVVSRQDAAAITGLFEAWSGARLLEDDPTRTGVVGATVAFSGEAPGYTWATPVPCWFSGAPKVTMAGAFCRVELEVVDAAQALAVLLRAGEEEAEQAAQLSLGTLTFGQATVNLTARAESFQDLPQLALNPAGRHVITGPLSVTETRQVAGWVTPANLANLETWLATTAATSPASGAWFPTSWTTPVARRRADGGAIGTYYDVNFSVSRIR